MPLEAAVTASHAYGKSTLLGDWMMDALHLTPATALLSMVQVTSSTSWECAVQSGELHVCLSSFMFN